VPTVLYTMIGGVQAVTWADVKQMVLIVFGAARHRGRAAGGLPVPDRRGAAALRARPGRLRTFDFSFNLTETYTFWSGSWAAVPDAVLLRHRPEPGAALSDGALGARGAHSLLMSAYWKIPLQALVLLIGVLVFVFYLFQAPPLLFNPAHDPRVRAEAGAEYGVLESRFIRRGVSGRRPPRAIWQSRRCRRDGGRRAASWRGCSERGAHRGTGLAGRVTGEPSRDVNYIIPHFVLNYLPIGLAGSSLPPSWPRPCPASRPS
jgi:solute:Na+ symporter, SSS family